MDGGVRQKNVNMYRITINYARKNRRSIPSFFSPFSSHVTGHGAKWAAGTAQLADPRAPENLARHGGDSAQALQDGWVSQGCTEQGTFSNKERDWRDTVQCFWWFLDGMTYWSCKNLLFCNWDEIWLKSCDFLSCTSSFVLALDIGKIAKIQSLCTITAPKHPLNARISTPKVWPKTW